MAASPNHFLVCRLKLLPVLVLLSVTLFTWPKDGVSASNGMALRVYSSGEYSSQEGERYGLEVTFVPFYGGVRVLWRMASGKVWPPVLTDAVKENDTWVIEVPVGEEGTGKWILKESAGRLTATGPNGLKFQMRRRF